MSSTYISTFLFQKMNHVQSRSLCLLSQHLGQTGEHLSQLRGWLHQKELLTASGCYIFMKGTCSS